jgi:hypothetical protein
VPSWLDRLPENAGRMYAYGYSGPTFRADDAVEYAGDDAVDNLAKALRSHVQAYQLLIENNTGLSVDEFSRTERPDDDFRALVKKNSKVDTTWIDQKGLKAGYPAGSVWALAYIEVGNTKGGYQRVANDDTGPALTATGEVGSGQRKAEAKPAKATDAPVQATPASAVTPGAAPAPAPAGAAPTAAPAAGPSAVAAPPAAAAPVAPPRVLPKDNAGKPAPYPSEGEKCRPGYESTGGWCLPLEK